MGILQDIADGKPIQKQTKTGFVPAELVETFTNIGQSIEKNLAESAKSRKILEDLQAKNLEKMANCDAEIARLEAEIAAKKPQKSPPKAPENVPPVLRPTAPLGYLMNERAQKKSMEDGTWDMIITIETLGIDELVKPSDFVDHPMYVNHRDHVLKSTPPDMFPGFRLKVKVGLLTSGKRVILPCVSKESVMHSPEFITNLMVILALIKKKSGLPG